jgi:hypothetical protein
MNRAPRPRSAGVPIEAAHACQVPACGPAADEPSGPPLDTADRPSSGSSRCPFGEPFRVAVDTRTDGVPRPAHEAICDRRHRPCACAGSAPQIDRRPEASWRVAATDHDAQQRSIVARAGTTIEFNSPMLVPFFDSSHRLMRLECAHHPGKNINTRSFNGG